MALPVVSAKTVLANDGGLVRCARPRHVAGLLIKRRAMLQSDHVVPAAAPIVEGMQNQSDAIGSKAERLPLPRRRASCRGPGDERGGRSSNRGLGTQDVTFAVAGRNRQRGAVANVVVTPRPTSKWWWWA